VELVASGVYTIAATPFREDGALDTASVDSLTDFYLRCGVSGITVLGVMGEATKLDAAESVALVRQFVKRAGQVPVVVGVTAPGFAPMRALADALRAAARRRACRAQIHPEKARRDRLRCAAQAGDSAIR